MQKFGQIPLIQDGVVFSDPWYDENVWCQYREKFTATDWLVKMETKISDGFISIQMVLGRPTVLASIMTKETEKGLEINFPARYQVKDVELGMDTASIFCGTREHWNNFAKEASIRTGTDGIFGDLMVFTCKGENEPAGFLLTAGLEEIFMNENELIDHFFSSFDAKEITPEMFQHRTSSKSLAYRMTLSAEVLHAKEAVSIENGVSERESER